MIWHATVRGKKVVSGEKYVADKELASGEKPNSKDVKKVLDKVNSLIQTKAELVDKFIKSGNNEGSNFLNSQSANEFLDNEMLKSYKAELDGQMNKTKISKNHLKEIEEKINNGIKTLNTIEKTFEK